MIRIGKIVGAFVRGVVKAFPLGNAIIEGVNNVKGGPLKDVITTGGETVKGQIKDPHNWVSILTQVAVIGVIVWALATGKIDVKQALSWLN